MKVNNRKLWETIALQTALYGPRSVCESYQQSHGREVFRRIELFDNQASIPHEWHHIERVVKVRRWGKRNQKAFHELTFYILSKPIDSAYEVSKVIENHWAIENKLHWIKDVNLGEDHMTPQQHNTVALIAYLNNMALNALRMAGYKPIKDTFAKFANKVHPLARLFFSQLPT